MIEARILEILKKCHDLSAMSDELSSRVIDGQTEFHFSPARANLLRPFPFGPEDSVLEVGAGGGALTRWLAESGAGVVALEASPAGRQSIAERCRDLPNVPAVYTSFSDIHGEHAFTVVTCIGTIEQADGWLRTEQPALNLLRQMADCLKPDGRLFLAIGNQLGLKFFGGCAEERTGTPFFGINDLYSPGGPGTYGKRELAQLLHSSGFTNLEWFYPFPDYRLPTLIISEGGLQDPRLNLADLLSDSFSKDYLRNYQPPFWEPLVWRAIARNGLLGELSNAFLVVARKEAPDSKNRAPSWLAKRYRAIPPQRYSKETTFLAEHSTVTIVRRRLAPSDTITAGTAAAPFRFTHVLADSSYVPGELYGPELYKILARGGTVDDIVRWMRPWVEFLEAHAVPSSLPFSSCQTPWLWLPGYFIDCIPFNLIIDADGCLHYIDTEWHSIDPIPLPWVIMRGLINRLALCPLGRGRLPLTYRALLDEVFSRVGIDATEELYSVLARFENAFLDFLHAGRESRAMDFAVVLSWPVGTHDQAHNLLAEFVEAKKTLGWHFLTLYWRAVERVFPRHSRLRRVFDSIARTCRRLIAA